VDDDNTEATASESKEQTSHQITKNFKDKDLNEWAQEWLKSHNIPQRPNQRPPPSSTTSATAKLPGNINPDAVRNLFGRPRSPSTSRGLNYSGSSPPTPPYRHSHGNPPPNDGFSGGQPPPSPAQPNILPPPVSQQDLVPPPLFWAQPQPTGMTHTVIPTYQDSEFEWPADPWSPESTWPAAPPWSPTSSGDQRYSQLIYDEGTHADQTNIRIQNRINEFIKELGPAAVAQIVDPNKIDPATTDKINKIAQQIGIPPPPTGRVNDLLAELDRLARELRVPRVHVSPFQENYRAPPGGGDDGDNSLMTEDISSLNNSVVTVKKHPVFPFSAVRTTNQYGLDSSSSSNSTNHSNSTADHSFAESEPNTSPRRIYPELDVMRTNYEARQREVIAAMTKTNLNSEEDATRRLQITDPNTILPPNPHLANSGGTLGIERVIASDSSATSQTVANPPPDPTNTETTGVMNPQIATAETLREKHDRATYIDFVRSANVFVSQYRASELPEVVVRQFIGNLYAWHPSTPDLEYGKAKLLHQLHRWEESGNVWLDGIREEELRDEQENTTTVEPESEGGETALTFPLTQEALVARAANQAAAMFTALSHRVQDDNRSVYAGHYIMDQALVSDINSFIVQIGNLPNLAPLVKEQYMHAGQELLGLVYTRFGHKKEDIPPNAPVGFNQAPQNPYVIPDNELAQILSPRKEPIEAMRSALNSTESSVEPVMQRRRDEQQNNERLLNQVVGSTRSNTMFDYKALLPSGYAQRYEECAADIQSGQDLLTPTLTMIRDQLIQDAPAYESPPINYLIQMRRALLDDGTNDHTILSEVVTIAIRILQEIGARGISPNLRIPIGTEGVSLGTVTGAQVASISPMLADILRTITWRDRAELDVTRLSVAADMFADAIIKVATNIDRHSVTPKPNAQTQTTIYQAVADAFGELYAVHPQWKRRPTDRLLVVPMAEVTQAIWAALGNIVQNPQTTVDVTRRRDALDAIAIGALQLTDQPTDSLPSTTISSSLAAAGSLINMVILEKLSGVAFKGAAQLTDIQNPLWQIPIGGLAHYAYNKVIGPYMPLHPGIENTIKNVKIIKDMQTIATAPTISPAWWATMLKYVANDILGRDRATIQPPRPDSSPTQPLDHYLNYMLSYINANPPLIEDPSEYIHYLPMGHGGECV